MNEFLKRAGLFTSLFVAVACGVTKPQELPAPEVSDPVYRVATYNVGVFGKSGTNTTGMVAAMLKEMDVQVVSLNEVDCRTARHPEDQLSDLADSLGGWRRLYAPAMDYKGGQYGDGIVYEPHMELLGRMQLQLLKGEGAEPRALAVCEFEDFVFCSTHLDHISTAAQLVHAKRITDCLTETYGASGKPVILCGDLNAEPDGETLALLKENWTILSPTGNTFPADKPIKCIDYIMVLKSTASRLKLLDAAIVSDFTSGDVTVASDHLPVVVSFKVE
jgi:endonuclease/exonuclease/phosphatase family metal-dependent hydrolase